MADCYLNRAVKGAKVKTEILDEKGKVVASNVADARNSDEAHVDFQAKAPKQWTAETPHLYTAVFTLQDAAGKTLHRERQKFGFRTIEYRASDGVYINGQKVIFKGVNRHSFRPETGRTLSKAKNIEDVKLIKSMNMNAVRLSHYPADPEFLEACDSLGLYVECELSGWHWAHPTVVGKQLVKEMITRDENHPSIIFGATVTRVVSIMNWNQTLLSGISRSAWYSILGLTATALKPSTTVLMARPRSICDRRKSSCLPSSCMVCMTADTEQD